MGPIKRSLKYLLLMAFSLFNKVINYHVYLLLAHCKTFFIVKGHIHPQSHGTSKTMFFSQNSCCFFFLFVFVFYT